MSFKRNKSLIAVALLSCVIADISLCANVYSQDFPRYRPRPTENEPNRSRLPDTPREVTGDPKVLVDELKALIFVDHLDKIRKEAIDVTGVQIESDGGLRLLRRQSFQQLAEGYLGGPISIRRLNELVRDVIVYYRRNNQPVVDVSIPDQRITDGVVQVVVTEARVGEVRVEGACYFNPCVLVNQTCISPGNRIYESVLMRDLERLNRNPFREVDLRLRPGDEKGETDIVFNVRDRLPVRVYAGYEDTGTQQTGLERTIYGVNWGNAMWRDHQAAYQLTASSDFNQLLAHSGVYSLDLWNDDSLMFYGSYAEINSQAAGAFGLTGIAWQSAMRWERELCPIGCFSHAMNAGFDFKSTNTNLEFGGANVFASAANVVQFMLGYKASSRGHYGATSLAVDCFYSPGNFGGNNTDTAFNTIRAGAQANYFYSRLRAERQIEMPFFLQFVGRFTGQLAEGNLLPSEQLGFGGFNSIRGYNQYTTTGDSGYIINLEVGPDPFYLGLCDDQLRVFGFYDIGDARNHTVAAGADPSIDLSGVGVGLNYSIARRLWLRAEYGWQLSAVAGQTNPRQRWHLNAVIMR